MIEIALAEIDKYVLKYYHGDKSPMMGTTKALGLLKDELINYPESIKERVLRSMHDTGMRCFKEYENTSLETAIDAVTEILYHGILTIKLAPLRMDFDKGDPIYRQGRSRSFEQLTSLAPDSSSEVWVLHILSCRVFHRKIKYSLINIKS